MDLELDFGNLSAMQDILERGYVAFEDELFSVFMAVFSVLSYFGNTVLEIGFTPMSELINDYFSFDKIPIIGSWMEGSIDFLFQYSLFEFMCIAVVAYIAIRLIIWFLKLIP